MTLSDVPWLLWLAAACFAFAFAHAVRAWWTAPIVRELRRLRK